MKKIVFFLMFFCGLLVCHSPSANAEVGGVYLSQFQASDPRASTGGTDPVYLIVVQSGNSVLATANAEYSPAGSSLRVKVWSYTLANMDASMSGTAAMVDSFGVCNVTIRFSYINSQWVIATLSSQNKQGVANPLNIDCLDLYPLNLTREFTKIF